jgi:PAS domain S-box-containing protein
MQLVGKDHKESEHPHERPEFQLLSENVPFGLVMIGQDGTFRYLNPKFKELFGYDLADIPNGRAWFRRAYPDADYRHQVISVWKGDLEHFKPGEKIPKIFKVSCKDGSEKVINFITVQLETGENLITCEDITAHKRREEALRRSEERFRELYDHAPVGYHEYDTEGRITHVNQTDLEMLGYTADEMIGQPMWKFNVGEEIAREQILKKLAGALPPGRGLERTYRRKDGTTFPVLIEDRLILDERGRISGIRCIIQDITERKRAETEMLALQDQLRQATKMEAVGRLAGGIAHDFNNVLTIISGYSQLSLGTLEEGDPLRENLEEIQRGTERAAALTRQLLAFSRRQIMEMRVLDLNTVLRDLEKLLRPIIGEDIELITILSEELGKTKVDPGQIEQVIVNLAVNARDAMPAGGKFILETSNVELDEDYARSHIGVRPGPCIGISVSDTGAGISMEVRERIFEPFFTTKEIGKGTGLGLSTVYGIVKQSGGDILVSSEVGRGTTFRLYFPRVDEASEATKLDSASSQILPGFETILLVEDEEAVRTLARKTLESCGYHILEASNGQEALRVVQESPEKTIHLLLTDVVMPGMGGRDLAELLTRWIPGLKVLYMSGYTDDAIVDHGILNPGIHFLQKPFSPRVLIQKIQDMMKNRLERVE